MVTAVTAGNLQVEMGLNSAAFQSDVKKTMGSIDRSTRATTSSLKVAGAAAAGFFSAFSVSTISRVTLDALRFAGAIGDTSRALGLNTKELQGYRYAATQSGVATGDLESGLDKLQQKLGLARSGAGKEAGMFKALGIDLTDAAGKAKSSGAVFEEVVGRIAGIEDPAQRGAAAAKIFGEDMGPKLLPLLEKGQQGMDELRAAAERLGITLSDSAIQKADEATEKIDALQTVLQMKIAGTISENADAIVKLAGSVTDLTASAIQFAATDLERIKEVGGVLAGAYAGSRVGGLPGAVAGGAAGGFAAAGGQRRGSGVVYDRAGGGIRGAWNVLTSSRDDLLEAGREADLQDSIMSNWELPGAGRISGTGTGAVNLEALLGDKPKAAKAARAPRAAKASSNDNLEWLYGLPDQGAIDEMETYYDGLKSSIDAVADANAWLTEAENDAAFADIESYYEGIQKKLEAGSNFAKEISDNLAQGLVYGQNLGSALINSLKAAAAEAISNGFFDLLKSASSGGGGWLGTAVSAVGSFLSGGKANGGYAAPGTRFLVGERGPEVFESPGTGGTIRPNGWFGNMAGESKQSEGRMIVDVQPSPLFTTTVALASEQGGARAASRVVKRATSRTLSSSYGA